MSDAPRKVTSTDGLSSHTTRLTEDRSSSPVLTRPAASAFGELWSDPGSPPDPFTYLDSLTSTTELTQEDCVDVFLADQRRRWGSGHGIFAEDYRAYLRKHFDHPKQDLEWELVAHEFILAQAVDMRPPSVHVPEYIDRFPEFRERLAALFRSDDFSSTEVLNETRDLDELLSATMTLAATLPRVPGSAKKKKRDPMATVLDIEEPDESSIPYQPDSYRHDESCLLGRIPPFCQLPPPIVRKVDQCLEDLTYRAGEPLITQGDPADGLYLVTDGHVQIRSTDDSGNARVLAEAGAGEILGEMAMLTDEPRTADVIATSTTSVRFLPAPVFHELASEYPVIGRVLTQLLAERLGKKGHDALSGKTFGQYRIMRRLGRGGMAIVYQAEEIETGDMVALKMMSHRLVYDANALGLFQRESRMIESFNHPGIVRMLGRFKAFRSFFIVLEFCNGVTLDRVVHRSGPLPEEQFKSVIAQLADALAYAHQNGIVHRDVKPSNVMLTSSDEVKLMDFGLARPIDAGEATGRNLIAGTPRYMAPEQMLGDLTNPRADLFSLGCTAWKLLTGEDLIQDTRISDIQKRHDNWEIPELSGISDEVREFIHQCLQIDPEKRDVDLAAISEWC